jgi:hypothetical protein
MIEKIIHRWTHEAKEKLAKGTRVSIIFEGDVLDPGDQFRDTEMMECDLDDIILLDVSTK